MILSISCKQVLVQHDDYKNVDVVCYHVQDSQDQMEHIVDFLNETYGEKFLAYVKRVYLDD